MTKRFPSWCQDTDETFWHMIDYLDRNNGRDLRIRKDAYIGILLDMWEKKND